MPRDDSGELEFTPASDDIAEYVSAYLEVERPTSTVERATWSAIEDATAETSRGPWVVVAMLAAAACLLMVWINRDALTPEAAIPAPSQAPYQTAPGDGAPHGETQTLQPAAERQGAPATQAPAEAPAVIPAAPSPQPQVPAIVKSGDGRAPSVRKPGRAKPMPAAAGPSSLARETEQLKAIQEALVAGRHNQALAGSTAYQHEFPRGAFRHEVTIARARALCGLGRANDARKLAKSFAAKHPTSHLAARALEICAD